MKHYLVTTDERTRTRNDQANLVIHVYSLKRNQPTHIGFEIVDTRSFCGVIPVANQIISKVTGKRMIDNYDFVNNNDINIHRL